MASVSHEAYPMARKELEAGDRPVGPLLAWNLYRLGYADLVVRSSEVANLVKEKTGKGISRQRISALMNAVRVDPETIEMLAKAVGCKPADLLRDDGPRRGK